MRAIWDSWRMRNSPAFQAASTGRAFLQNAGELGGLIDRFDWGATASGAIAGWPAKMKSDLALCCAAPRPS